MKLNGVLNRTRISLWVWAAISGALASVLWLVAWLSLYTLGNVMDKLVSLEEIVAIGRVSVRSVSLLLAEATVGSALMLLIWVVILLFPALFWWWAIKVKGAEFSRYERATALLLVLLIPPALTAGALCFLFVHAPWSQKVCSMFGARGWYLLLGYVVMLPVSRFLRKRV